MTININNKDFYPQQIIYKRNEIEGLDQWLKSNRITAPDGRIYEVYTKEFSHSEFSWKFLKGIIAFAATFFSFGLGLLSNDVRTLWKQSLTGLETRKIKVESSNPRINEIKEPIIKTASLPIVTVCPLSPSTPASQKEIQKNLNTAGIPLEVVALELQQPNKILTGNAEVYLEKCKKDEPGFFTKYPTMPELIKKYYESIDLITLKELKDGLFSCCQVLNKALAGQEYAIGLETHTPYSWTAGIAMSYLNQMPKDFFSMKDRTQALVKNNVVIADVLYSANEVYYLIEKFSKELKSNPSKQLYIVVPFTSEEVRNFVAKQNASLDKQVHLITSERPIKAMKDRFTTEDVQQLIMFNKVFIDNMLDWDSVYFQNPESRKRQPDVQNRYTSIPEWRIPQDDDIPQTLKYVQERSKDGYEEVARFVTNFDPPYKKNRSDEDQPFIVRRRYFDEEF